MRRVGAACLAWVVLAAPVLAAGYDDFTRGMTANLRGDSATAVVSFSAALAASDLVPVYKPAAFRGRASAYLAQDKCSEALADLKAYEGLKKPDNTVIALRVWAELCLKDAVAARKDLDTVAQGKLDVADLWDFSRLEWRYGLFDDATATAREAFKIADKKQYGTAYILLWQALSAVRAGKLDAGAIAVSLAELKLDDWPGPILDLYLGKQTPAGVQKEASSWRESKETAQRCEANFYTAEWYLGRNDTAAATPLLLAVNEKCPIDFIELTAARAELKRLGVPLPKE